MARMLENGYGRSGLRGEPGVRARLRVRGRLGVRCKSAVRGKPGYRGMYLRGLLVLALALTAISTPAYAKPGEHPHHPVNLSFFYPIATNRDPETSTNFRLNLIYGDIGAVRGVDLNALIGRVRGDMAGLQANGLFAYVAGGVRGATFSGVASYVESDFVGFQYSGLVNFTRADFSGLQLSDLFNYVEGDFHGIQGSALFNMNNGDVKYLQLGTIANMVGAGLTGVQASAGLNFVNDRMSGCQFGICNFARGMEGVQIGVGNVAGHASGFQAGVINFANELDGVPLGVINITKEGDVDWVTSGSTLAALSTGVRTIHRGFYSVLAIGVGDLNAERNDTAFLSWHYGHAWPLNPRWKIGFDAGFLHIVPTPSSDETVNDKLHYAIQGRVLAELKISERTKFFGGGGISVIFSEYSSDATTETDPLLVLGVSVY